MAENFKSKWREWFLKCCVFFLFECENMEWKLVLTQLFRGNSNVNWNLLSFLHKYFGLPIDWLCQHDANISEKFYTKILIGFDLIGFGGIMLQLKINYARPSIFFSELLFLCVSFRFCYVFLSFLPFLLLSIPFFHWFSFFFFCFIVFILNWLHLIHYLLGIGW